jgi:CO/xanthine dehydrogenase Mo-binding subunit
MELVGQPAERVEAAEKATGVALFAADFVMAGMLYGKILRSPHAHARILSIDTSKAEALPGVVAVATEADTPGKRFGFVVADETIFAEDEVRFKSQAVAAVAAVDPYIAEEALGLIEVQYEPLPAVFDMEEAMKPGAPLVHQDASQYGQGAVGIECQLEGNIISHPVVEGGDVEKGFAESDLVLEERYVTAAMHQGYLEPHACLAEFDANGKLTVWTSTQGHFYARGAISAFLDKPMSQVNVIPSEVGGAFGGKITPFIEVIAAVLAKKAAHPVQIVLSRQEDLEDARPRSATVTEVKTGVKRDGTIVARKVRFLVDGGAYADWTPGVAINSAKVARGPYRVPNYRLEAYSVYTNKFITGPMRAPGYPQLFFALESHLDEIAKRLGLTPFEIRLKNGLDAGDVTFVGNRLKTPVFLNMLKRVKKVIDSDPEKNVPNAAWGIGCGEWEIGGAVSGASLKLNEDGTVALLIGSTDLTGSKTSIAQVAAEELSLGLEDLAVTVGDTDTALTAPLSGGSQITYNMTNAVRVAARELTRQILAQGAKVLKVQPSALELKDGKVVVKGDPTKSVSFSDLGEVQLEAAVSCAAIPPAHSFAVQAVKVKVDPETGKVRILRAVGAQDCGTAVNPQSVEAQLGGGMAQCIGHALWEQVVFAEGAVMNNGLTEYTMPTARDVVHFEALLFEGEYGSGKGHGAKGIGEPVHIPAAAAVGNAIYNATGVRLREMPMTPERIWRAIEEAGV